MSAQKNHTKKRPIESRLTLLSLTSSIPFLLILLWTMIYAGISVWLILLTALLGGLLIVYVSYKIYYLSGYQFRSLSHLIDAMILGDYSLRARSEKNNGALGELVSSINGLSQKLSEQRLLSVESQLLVQTVIENIDVAIIALDDNNEICFHNPAATDLLLINEQSLNEELLEQLSFIKKLPSNSHQIVDIKLGRQHGRFNIHVEEFRDKGAQHKLLFITDVRTLLRSEERRAWQRLVRVISHEINNSLSPIASISQTLKQLVSRQENSTPGAHRADLTEGLSIISERANGLRQFVDSYKQLAKLPDPEKQDISAFQLVEKSSALFETGKIIIESATDVSLFVDPIQFEQVVINLLKNGIEAMSQVKSDGVIRVAWEVKPSVIKLTICDEGGGISNPDNLFIPFYSTKQKGSGIGLLLCRQIVEAHDGHLSLKNRKHASGCCASIELPAR